MNYKFAMFQKEPIVRLGDGTFFDPGYYASSLTVTIEGVPHYTRIVHPFTKNLMYLMKDKVFIDRIKHELKMEMMKHLQGFIFQ